MADEEMPSGPNVTTYEAVNVISIDYSGDCWAFHFSPPAGNGDYHHTCQRTGSIEDCIAVVHEVGGTTSTFKMHCSVPPAAPAYVDRTGHTITIFGWYERS